LQGTELYLAQWIKSATAINVMNTAAEMVHGLRRALATTFSFGERKLYRSSCSKAHARKNPFHRRRHRPGCFHPETPPSSDLKK
jgi:hypothetical protein